MQPLRFGWKDDEEEEDEVSLQEKKRRMKRQELESKIQMYKEKIRNEMTPEVESEKEESEEDRGDQVRRAKQLYEQR